MISRFRAAGEPGWQAPGEAELREHFADGFLRQFAPGDLIAALVRLAPEMRGELTVYGATPLSARVRLGGLDIIAAADAQPPHRLIAAQLFAAGSRVTD